MGMSTCRMAAPRLAFECVRPAGRALRSAATMRNMPLLMPPRIVPPAQPLGRIAFMKAFVRNPLQVLPRAAYEEDFGAFSLPKATKSSSYAARGSTCRRSEEHTSELRSHSDLVCRLLLEKKKKTYT